MSEKSLVDKRALKKSIKLIGKNRIGGGGGGGGGGDKVRLGGKRVRVFFILGKGTTVLEVSVILRFNEVK